MNYKQEMIGKEGIVARIVADSVCNDVRLTTYELEYPRFIHSEMMTHRMFSRNASSSRAVPTQKAIQQVKDNPAIPIYFGLNKPGMIAGEEHSDRDACVKAWKHMANATSEMVAALDEQNLHKQIAARPLETYQRIKVVLSATDFENFFWLRRDEAAQPEIKELADLMYKAREKNSPVELKEGDWHLPYYGEGWLSGQDDSIEIAKKISVSCCAQVSYRNLDDSIEKAERIYDMLIKADKVHASPFEQIATPINNTDWNEVENWPEGVTHMTKNKELYSGNFRGWVQLRALIPNNVKEEV